MSSAPHEEVMGLTIAPAEIAGHTLDGPVERISGLGRPGVTAFAAGAALYLMPDWPRGPCLDHIRAGDETVPGWHRGDHPDRITILLIEQPLGF